MKSLFTLLGALFLFGLSKGQSYLSNAVHSPGAHTSANYWNQGPRLGHVAILAGTNGYDLQGLVVIQSKFSLMVNGSLLTHAVNSNRFAEVAVGFNEKLDRVGRSSLSIYLGMGRGLTQSVAGSYSLLGSIVKDSFRGQYVRYFIQPEVSFQQKAFEFAISARTAYLDYASNEETVDGADSKLDRCLLYEPAFTLKFGSSDGFFKDKKVILQMGLIMGGEEMVQDPFKFNLGLAWKPSNKGGRRIINAADFF